MCILIICSTFHRHTTTTSTIHILTRRILLMASTLFLNVPISHNVSPSLLTSYATVSPLDIISLRSAALTRPTTFQAPKCTKSYATSTSPKSSTRADSLVLSRIKNSSPRSGIFALLHCRSSSRRASTVLQTNTEFVDISPTQGL